MNRYTMQDVILSYEKEERARQERIKQEIKAGLRVLVEINGKRVYATKKRGYTSYY